MLEKFISINKEVKEALENGKAVVALESTIISHGMPYPQNVETAMKVEKIIRENGCVPATIGIIEGTPIVGMSADEIELFGKTKGILKVSRRDLPVVMNPYDEKNSEPNFWLSCMLINKDAMCKQVRSDNDVCYIKEAGKTCPTEILEKLEAVLLKVAPVYYL